MSTSLYDVTSDSELKTRVRALTGYEDTPDELSGTDLDSLVNAAKHRLAVQTGSENWYSDSAMGMALVGTTCIIAKSAVENYSVSSWTIGDQTIDVNGAGNVEQAQFQQWSQMVATGIRQSGDTKTAVPTNTTDYIG